MQNIGLISKSCLIVLIALFFVSCKKTTPPDACCPHSAPKVEQPAAEPAVVATPAPQAEATKTEEKQQEAVKEEPAKTDSNSASSDMEPVDIKLPKPVFIGTPEMVTVSNLEKPTGELRKPFYAPKGTTNVAAGKSATSNQEPIIGDLGMLTDSDKEAGDGSFIEFGPGLTYVTIDLESQCDIYAIVLWHYHQQARVYFDVVIQVSDDPDFIKDVKTVFNNDDNNTAGQGVGPNKNYTETFEGRLFDTKGIKGRYVRLYSNGNSGNELNHYIEVEVYGKAAK